MSEVSRLHNPTPDVQATFDWLLGHEFSVVGSTDGTGMGQEVELSDGQTRIRVICDRGQWMLDVSPQGWDESASLDQLLAAMRLEHVPTEAPQGVALAQLPPGEVWADCLPTALAWAAGQPHRAVFAEVERHRYGSRNFGGRGRPPSLRQIERWVGVLAAAIDSSARHLPTYGRTADFARPHIETSDTIMSYVVVERGQEIERHGFGEPGELLQHIFLSVTFSMAVEWEVGHRNEAEDFRRMWAKQLVLLDQLHPLWAARLSASYVDRFRSVGLDPYAAANIVNEADPPPG